MRRILVTGANKGIGLAIAKAILDEHEDTFVYLGTRDLERGQAAAASLGAKERLEVVALDVADERSVAAAGKRISEKLYGLVNNAGIGTGSGVDLAAMFQVNTLGMQRVTETILPLLDPKHGRIVNITSASGPMFVASCSPEMQRFFLDAQITWPRLKSFIDECVALGNDKQAFEAKGLGDGASYGLTKACANSYTLLLAREHPELRVNACTPGFIETDMTRGYTGDKSSMKPPSEGAKTPMFLLFGNVEGNGHYYGSDAKRSPLDRYRAPGSAPFRGS
jgi:NAD(P)-dependent dehydrogenase (short-subunit alcohol dehydrogenase family)